ncbi:TrkH family potassium uptake protein [Photobacterium damselae]|uniref:TrkH family potassium uptake protein n=1 Tax=Photobacterium damselae TaxID=38293 RepID=UPI000D074912|nr:TrkH family potassium uptake protein [Photobacterium damselae]AWK80659.1 potassium transporter [Photobacterium damselae]EHA1082121.1 potassium transporter [Photobacterium damselae]MCG3817414.1 potassium transporter [Photobacterium damselae]PSB83429.1 potassium transporter [Photobacterium damselae subsp. damselae]PSB88223.1 potassium transporter [Photobacterium damselae subsp. damselae]
MQFRSIIRIVGLLLAFFSVTMLAPALVALIYRDGAGVPFIVTFFLLFAGGAALWFPNRRHRHELKAREGFLIVVLFWVVIGSAGAVPFILSHTPDLSVTDSFFESFSALTTTGATVIVGLDTLPKAILFYRQFLQWFGGMGIIVLAVAVLPVLGIGGMQLYRAEIPGPVKDSKMTPRIAETAKTLWFIYLALTVSCALAFWVAGMTPFDAIAHSFSTIAIGGFSTHDASMGYFNSPTINMITVVFLLISACNFSLHFAAFANGGIRLRTYWRDPEFRAFLFIQLMLFVICFAILVNHHSYDSYYQAMDQALFQTVSISTTAGFTTTGFSDWPLFLPVLLLFSSFIGGCAGSTGGGMKVIRMLLLSLQGVRELKRLIHPRAVYTIKLGKKALPQRVVDAVWGFFSAYALVFVVCMLALIATGLDELTSFSAVAATLNNLGPGLGEVAVHFGEINDPAKWILVVAMLFGRLEVFTLLVLFTPTFWRN